MQIFYTRSDFWMALGDDGIATLGLTEHGQSELGELVFIELPGVGRRIVAGQSLGIVESVKAVAELKMPVGGEVVAINEAATQNPDLVNESPRGDGWLLRFRPNQPLEANAELLDEATYNRLRVAPKS